MIPARATLGPEPIRVAVPPMLAASATLSVSAALNRLNSALADTNVHTQSYSLHRAQKKQGPDLQNILRQSYDYLTIMPKLRATYDGRLVCQTSYEERKAFLGYDLLARS